MVSREAQCLGRQRNHLLGSREGRLLGPNKPHVRRPLIYIFPITFLLWCKRTLRLRSKCINWAIPSQSFPLQVWKGCSLLPLFFPLTLPLSPPYTNSHLHRPKKISLFRNSLYFFVVTALGIQSQTGPQPREATWEWQWKNREELQRGWGSDSFLLSQTVSEHLVPSRSLSPLSV